MQRELIRLAVTDSLTGMFNRRGFFEQALQPCRRAEEGTPLCAIMADIDYFKRINDEHGRDAGDKAIFAVAHELMSGSWHAGRLGGEEFALLLPDTDGAGAMILAERLRALVGDRPIETDAGALRVTVSIGISGFPHEATIASQLIRVADTRLYQAKQSGRNRVIG